MDEKKQATTSDVANAENVQASNTEAIASKEDASSSLKEEVERLRKEVEQARTLQSQSDRKVKQLLREKAMLEKVIKKMKKGENVDYLPYDYEVEEPQKTTTPFADDMVEKYYAQSEIIKMVYSNPKYRELLEKDKTLADIVSTKPLTLVDEWIDADYAISQVKDYFEKRLSSQEKVSSDIKISEESKVVEKEIPKVAPNIPSEEEKPQSKDIISSIRARLREIS